MLVFNITLNKKSKILLLTLIVAVAALIAASVCAAVGNAAEQDGADTTARLSFLKNHGYTCENEVQKEIVIPMEFDEVYETYNALQIEQGYNLKNYRGQTAELFSYTVSDYPGEDNVCAHLLVKDGVIIGGDVASNRIDGFMHGIVKASATCTIAEWEF